MARSKNDSLGITKPIMVYNPVTPKQMSALYDVIRKFTVIDDFSKCFLIWLFGYTGRLTQEVVTQIPLEYKQYGNFVYRDVRMIIDMWHLNLILKCMGSFMCLYFQEPTNDTHYWTIQITVKPGPNPNAAEIPFDINEIETIDLD